MGSRETAGWRWYELIGLVFPVVGVLVAVREAGDAEGPQGAETWVWFGIATAAGLVLGYVIGRRSSLAPRPRRWSDGPGPLIVTFLVLFLIDPPQWINLSIAWLISGFFLTYVLTRYQRAHAQHLV